MPRALFRQCSSVSMESAGCGGSDVTFVQVLVPGKAGELDVGLQNSL